MRAGLEGRSLFRLFCPRSAMIRRQNIIRDVSMTKNTLVVKAFHLVSALVNAGPDDRSMLQARIAVELGFWLVQMGAHLECS